MGMAASQARFLGLTARKSNVEYQGQQVNQERTALANDSANLYNQMMKLDVPTPPSANEFYKTSFVLEGSAEGDGTSDYSFVTATRTYGNDKEYSIVLNKNIENRASKDSDFYLSKAVSSDVDGKETWSFGSTTSKALTYVPSELSPYSEQTVTDKDGNTTTQRQQTVTPYRLYEADASISGAELCISKEDLASKNYLFYQDSKGQNYFVSKSQVESWKTAEAGRQKTLTTYSYTTQETTTVIGQMEVSDTGRYTSITVNSNENYGNLSGQTFNISTVTEKDEDGYKDAYNDYEYEKDVYDQTMEKINAQTEIIQSEDKQLELRLRELETEQNAISTEMDSVKKVIEDNVEKTFNIFG